MHAIDSVSVGIAVVLVDDVQLVSWIKKVEKIMRSNFRQNPSIQTTRVVVFSLIFHSKNYSHFLPIDRNFVFEIQFALTMEFRLNFLIVYGRLLNDPCSNAGWISFKLSTKPMYLDVSCGFQCIFNVDVGVVSKLKPRMDAWRGENNFVLSNGICKMNCEVFLRMNGRGKNWIESGIWWNESFRC